MLYVTFPHMRFVICIRLGMCEANNYSDRSQMKSLTEQHRKLDNVIPIFLHTSITNMLDLQVSSWIRAQVPIPR